MYMMRFLSPVHVTSVLFFQPSFTAVTVLSFLIHDLYIALFVSNAECAVGRLVQMVLNQCERTGHQKVI